MDDAVQTPTPAAVPVAEPATTNPVLDPTGTVPVAGSILDPAHPANPLTQPTAAPAPAVEGPAPPPGSIAEVDGSTTLPGPPPTVQEATRREYEAAAGVAKARADGAANVADQAKVQEKNDAAKAALLKQQAAEQAAEDERQRKGLDAATQERDRLRAEVRDFKFHNYWDTRTTGQFIQAGLGMILGGISYDPNHVNQAVKIVDTAISREWAQQQATLDKTIQTAKDAGDDVRELQSRYQFESGRLKLRQEAQLNALAAEADRLASYSKNQAGVLTAQRIAAEARVAAEQQGAAGLKEIANAHTQKLRDDLTRSETFKNYAEARAAAERARRDRGELTPKEQEAEAKTVYAQYQKGLEEIGDKKTGLAVKQHELDAAVSKVEKDPKNPLNWVALFDNMIRTNTGKAAIMSQYRLYAGHAAGSLDEANQFLAKMFSGRPSAKQQASALQAAKDSQAELYDEGGKANREFWDTANSDVRFQSNPKAANALRVLERMTFSKLHGYGQQSPATPTTANAQPTPKQAAALANGFKVVQ